MKKAARRLATISGLLAVLGLAAEIPGGCATGSADGGDGTSPISGPSGAVDSGFSSADDSGSSGEVDSGSSSAGDSGSGSGGDSASGSGGDSGSSGGGDSGSRDDSGQGDSGTKNDAGPTVIFSATCPTGTTYAEPFTTDPVADGTFTYLIGPSTYNPASGTLSLGTGSPNTQLWIGARPSWTNYTISVPVRIDTTGGNGGLTFRMESVPASPANNAGQMYFAGIATNQVVLGVENNAWTEFAGPTATFAVGTFYTLQVTANGSSFGMSVNGTSYVTSYTDGTFTFGSFGLRTFSSGMTFGAITLTCN